MNGNDRVNPFVVDCATTDFLRSGWLLVFSPSQDSPGSHIDLSGARTGYLVAGVVPVVFTHINDP
jgi:hypothetical protein